MNLYHFAYALNKPTSNVLFWAVTVVDAPREMPGVRLAIGSNAASVWWLNGQEVIGLYNDRQAVIDDGVSKRLTLKKGPNVIRAAIVNARRRDRLLRAVSRRRGQSESRVSRSIWGDSSFARDVGPMGLLVPRTHGGPWHRDRLQASRGGGRTSSAK